MAKIALIFNGIWSHYAFARAPKYRNLYELCYVYDLDQADLDAYTSMVIPFQSNHQELSRKRELIYQFLASGKKVFVEGDSSSAWLDATWEDRPVNNYWWVKNPDQPPVTKTDFAHPIYQGLKARHACWHTHGVYTQVPASARIIQENPKGEVITWETNQYGGTLLATTLDPIVEHGIQQITHLDHYVDRLTEWLCGVVPEGRFEVQEEDYGIEWQ